MNTSESRLIIIGASGLIGWELFVAATHSGIRVVGTYSDHPKDGLIRYDLRTQPLSDVIPDLGSSDTVYLLAAYSNPSWIYNHADVAHALNVAGTQRLIDEVSAAGARLIFMSSVEVFDGLTGGYSERSQPAPLNLYGRMKYAVEQHIATLTTPACIVRTGWNVGWSIAQRCVVKLTYETLLTAGARMAQDNTFSIADSRDTAAGLLFLVSRPEINCLHLASSHRLVRTELADLIIATSKRSSQMAYAPTDFASIPYTEPRARLNHLDCVFATTELGLSFRPAIDIIRDKVRLLDTAPLTSP
jgi:dTDP-4-dehydrorhamnose reductase